MPDANNEPISIREYARRKNMTDTYIRRMIKDGVITERCIITNPQNGRPMILPLFAEEDWAMNYSTKAPVNPERYRKSKKTYLKEKKQPTGTLPDVSHLTAQYATDPIPEDPLQGKKLPKAELDRLQSEVKFRLSMLELKEKEESLVDKAKVYRALYDIGQALRTNILSIPDKTIDNIRALPRPEAYALMQGALVEALTTISDIKDGSIKFKAKR